MLLLPHRLLTGLATALGLDLPAATPPASPGRMRQGSHLGLGYKLHVPADGAGPRVPLVVMLHGCTQDPDQFATATRMNELADREGFAVLYPAQSMLTNPRRCWNWFLPEHQTRGRGEPGAIAALVEMIAAGHDVDRSRIFVAGLSAGGGMAAVLAATYPELFAAATVVAGIPFAQARDVPTAYAVMGRGAADPANLAAPVRRAMGPRARTLPMLVLQGSEDPRVAAINGDHLARQWAEAHGLPAAPDETEAVPAGAHERPVEKARWRDPDGRVVVERWLIGGLAHAWPGGDARGTHVDPLGPSAAEAAWQFFVGTASPAAGDA